MTDHGISASRAAVSWLFREWWPEILVLAFLAVCKGITLYYWN